MITIINHAVEKLEDPFGILTGDRYEFFLHIDVPEDDELYTEKGLMIKVLYIIDDKGPRISQYYLIEKETNQYLDFDLEEDEEKLVGDYCANHTPSQEK